MRLLKRALVLALLLIAGLVGLILWMAGGIQSPRTLEPAIEQLEVPPLPRPVHPPDRLTVLTWNVAFGYGWGSEGTGSALPKEHFDKSLAHIGAVIAQQGVDIALLQEVDFDSTRSHGVDQATLLARLAGLPYVARAESWTAHWVPFPYWPIADQFGRMHSGGAILSRFPLSGHRVELLPKPAANPFWYNLFYLFRYLERVEMNFNGTKVQIYNTHLEAFDRSNRVEQTKHVAATLAASMTPLTLFGGDFNSVPPESPIRKGYPDELQTDHEGDPTVELVRGIAGLSDSVSTSTMTASPASFFTFPSHAPNRKLDYVFTGSGYVVEEVRVLRDEAGTASDHLPILLRLRLSQVAGQPTN